MRFVVFSLVTVFAVCPASAKLGNNLTLSQFTTQMNKDALMELMRGRYETVDSSIIAVSPDTITRFHFTKVSLYGCDGDMDVYFQWPGSQAARLTWTFVLSDKVNLEKSFQSVQQTVVKDLNLVGPYLDTTITEFNSASSFCVYENRCIRLSKNVSGKSFTIYLSLSPMWLYSSDNKIFNVMKQLSKDSIRIWAQDHTPYQYNFIETEGHNGFTSNVKLWGMHGRLQASQSIVGDLRSMSFESNLHEQLTYQEFMKLANEAIIELGTPASVIKDSHSVSYNFRYSDKFITFEFPYTVGAFHLYEHNIKTNASERKSK